MHGANGRYSLVLAIFFLFFFFFFFFYSTSLIFFFFFFVFSCTFSHGFKNQTGWSNQEPSSPLDQFGPVKMPKANKKIGQNWKKPRIRGKSSFAISPVFKTLLLVFFFFFFLVLVYLWLVLFFFFF